MMVTLAPENHSTFLVYDGADKTTGIGLGECRPLQKS